MFRRSATELPGNQAGEGRGTRYLFSLNGTRYLFSLNGTRTHVQRLMTTCCLLQDSLTTPRRLCVSGQRAPTSRGRLVVARRSGTRARCPIHPSALPSDIACVRGRGRRGRIHLVMPFMFATALPLPLLPPPPTTPPCTPPSAGWRSWNQMAGKIDRLVSK